MAQKSQKKSSKKTAKKAAGAAAKKSEKKQNSENDIFDQIENSLPQEGKKNFKDIRKVLEQLREKAIKEIGESLKGLALLPPQKKKDEKTGKEEVDRNTINALILVDDTQVKNWQKFYNDTQKKVDDIKKSISDRLNCKVVYMYQLWNEFYDGKYETAQEISMSLPFYDKGYLAAVKICEVHKSMVLKKFEKYIVTYVLAGSLMQGRATEKSDIDVFIVIDDTDVKRMSRVELKEKLRAIIIGMGIEAGDITGIRNKLNIQIYILTEFWNWVKEANPIMFTFLRDGVPLYDRGMFMPWKLLLKQGKIRPSQEAIDLYMSSGQQVLSRVKLKLKEIGMEDCFWALMSPSQAALMLYGLTPPTPKETAELMREIFVRKEKMLEDKYVKILERVLKTRKDLEHGEKKELSGKEIDALYEESESYLKRIEKLFEEIQQRRSRESIVELLDAVNNSLTELCELSEVTHSDLSKAIKALTEKKILPPQSVKEYSELLKAKKDYEAGKLTKSELEKSKTDGNILFRTLIDAGQRKRLSRMDNYRLQISLKEGNADVFIIEGSAYLVSRNDNKVRRFEIAKDGTLAKEKEAGFEELEKAMEKAKPRQIAITKGLIASLEKVLGEPVTISAK